MIFHDFPMLFHMIFHEMLNISIQIYVLGPSHFLSSPPGKLSCWPGSTIRRAVCTSFYVRWIANNNSHQRIQQTWGVHSFNKHEKFSCLKFGAEQTNLHGVSWCVNELILKDKSTTKVGQSQRDPSGPFTDAA